MQTIPLTVEEGTLLQNMTNPIGIGPRFIDDEGAHFEPSAYDIIKKLRANGIITTIIKPSEKPELTINENSIDLILPALFISLPYASQIPDLVSISINIISSYAYDFLKSRNGAQSVRLDIAIKKKTSTKKIRYEGPVEGLEEIKEILKNEGNDE